MGAAGLHCRIHVTTGVSLRKVLESISRSIERISSQRKSARGCRVQAGMTTQQERAYLSVCALFSELCKPQPKKQSTIPVSDHGRAELIEYLGVVRNNHTLHTCDVASIRHHRGINSLV